jgi:hypothetical protein
MLMSRPPLIVIWAYRSFTHTPSPAPTFLFYCSTGVTRQFCPTPPLLSNAQKIPATKSKRDQPFMASPVS